ncbi:MAG: hypothetical protein FWG99_06065 [Treponema sp.]|nr:hypothetical protein [Treponema sp.]
MRRIRISEIEGKKALCFDTGLDSPSFARAKAAQYIAESGFIVTPEGSVEKWTASGVIEESSSMLIWGPPFEGKPVTRLVSAGGDTALAAIARWIWARLCLEKHCLGEKQTPNPAAALIAGHGGSHPEGSVFFAPESLSGRCISVEEEKIEHYTCQYLEGMEAAAFSAAAMLYRSLAGAAPFPAADESAAHQDMRDGNFTPVKFAAAGLNENLAGPIQTALMLAAGIRKPGENGTDILNQMLAILMPAGTAAPASSLFTTLAAAQEEQLNREKEKFLKRKNAEIKTRRFAIRNKAILAVSAIVLVITFFSVSSILKSRAERPTTNGMSSGEVVMSYYSSFSGLDHQMMDACLAKGADRSDLDLALNLFVITRVRQAYEFNFDDAESGLLNIKDLVIERIWGSEETSEIRYSAAYELSLPGEIDPTRHRDELTLERRRGKWQITEIKRSLL